VKLGVLAVLVLTLWVVANALLYVASGPFRLGVQRISVLPVLCAVFVAPWLTMACRNTIAGTVFTMAVPSAMLTAGEWLGAAIYGPGREMEAFRIAMLWRGTLGLCAIGAVAGWWMFMRLEAIEGQGQDVSLPQWWRRPTAGRTKAPTFAKRHPVWLLMKKELHLQQMALVVAGLYLLGRIAFGGDAFVLLSFSYIGLMSLLIGSLASAGERQLGTLDWQVLLPLATSKQWAVKMAVVGGLVILLALGLPAVLASLDPAMDLKPSFIQSGIAVVIVLLTVSSLYVSSLCSSGLMALLMSLPVTLGALAFMGSAIVWAATTSLPLVSVMRPPGSVQLAPTRLISVLSLLLLGVFIAIVQRLALANHLSAERSVGRVWRQVILLVAFVSAGVLILAGAEALQNGYFRR
jgi:hypothetical protein